MSARYELSAFSLEGGLASRIFNTIAQRDVEHLLNDKRQLQGGGRTKLEQAHVLMRQMRGKTTYELSKLIRRVGDQVKEELAPSSAIILRSRFQKCGGILLHSVLPGDFAYSCAAGIEEASGVENIIVRAAKMRVRDEGYKKTRSVPKFADVLARFEGSGFPVTLVAGSPVDVYEEVSDQFDTLRLISRKGSNVICGRVLSGIGEEKHDTMLVLHGVEPEYYDLSNPSDSQAFADRVEEIF